MINEDIKDYFEFYIITATNGSLYIDLWDIYHSHLWYFCTNRKHYIRHLFPIIASIFYFGFYSHQYEIQNVLMVTTYKLSFHHGIILSIEYSLCHVLWCSFSNKFLFNHHIHILLFDDQCRMYASYFSYIISICW